VPVNFPDDTVWIPNAEQVKKFELQSTTKIQSITDWYVLLMISVFIGKQMLQIYCLLIESVNSATG
jgi:hypothetical protein